MSCLFVGEYTEKGLPRPLAPLLFLPFTSHKDYIGRILVAPTTEALMLSINLTHEWYRQNVSIHIKVNWIIK